MNKKIVNKVAIRVKGKVRVGGRLHRPLKKKEAKKDLEEDPTSVFQIPEKLKSMITRKGLSVSDRKTCVDLVDKTRL